MMAFALEPGVELDFTLYRGSRLSVAQTYFKEMLDKLEKKTPFTLRDKTVGMRTSRVWSCEVIKVTMNPTKTGAYVVEVILKIIRLDN